MNVVFPLKQRDVNEAFLLPFVVCSLFNKAGIGPVDAVGNVRWRREDIARSETDSILTRGAKSDPHYFSTSRTEANAPKVHDGGAARLNLHSPRNITRYRQSGNS